MLSKEVVAVFEMKILIVHNHYGIHTGEEAIVDTIRNLLDSHGHEVILFLRSSEEIPNMRFGKIRAFFAGIYNPFSRRAFRRLLEEQKPDIVHIQNLFPFISPAILPECQKAGVAVVMTVQNYRLVCPNGLHMVHREVCEKCCGGREYWCILRNCERNPAKTLGYALRNYVSRKRRYYLDTVTIYAAVTQFQRLRLMSEGFPDERIVVNPNMASIDYSPPKEQSTKSDGFIAHVGRISHEKGIPTLLEAARKCPDKQFKATGFLDRMPELAGQAPSNFEFVGFLDTPGIKEFFVSARMIVICTICFEGFPMVVVEAMLYGKAVICSRIGGLPEIVEDGKTGLLFEPGNAEELAEKIRYLWERPELCRKMGEAGREKALREYSPGRYYERLMVCYEKAIDIASNNVGHRSG